MNTSRIFFIVFAAVIAFVGLLASAMAHDYLHGFGLGLFAFGVLFIFGCVRRHFDEADGTAEP